MERFCISKNILTIRLSYLINNGCLYISIVMSIYIELIISIILYEVNFNAIVFSDVFILEMSF